MGVKQWEEPDLSVTSLLFGPDRTFGLRTIKNAQCLLSLIILPCIYRLFCIPTLNFCSSPVSDSAREKNLHYPRRDQGKEKDGEQMIVEKLNGMNPSREMNSINRPMQLARCKYGGLTLRTPNVSEGVSSKVVGFTSITYGNLQRRRRHSYYDMHKIEIAISTQTRLDREQSCTLHTLLGWWMKTPSIRKRKGHYEKRR